jgi:hypothetical protein
VSGACGECRLGRGRGAGCGAAGEAKTSGKRHCGLALEATMGHAQHSRREWGLLVG